VGCYACEIACKAEFNLPVGPRRIRVIEVTKDIGGRTSKNFLPVHCMHCTRPLCIDVCPIKAISQRADGIVLINSSLCTGCKACFEVCQFGALQLNPETLIAEKCTMCVHRIDKGLKPACVLTCPTGALRFGDANDFVKLKRERYALSFV
jgi:Fe-S-cluster-containing dehydrogenase component